MPNEFDADSLLETTLSQHLKALNANELQILPPNQPGNPDKRSVVTTIRDTGGDSYESQGGRQFWGELVLIVPLKEGEGLRFFYLLKKQIVEHMTTVPDPPDGQITIGVIYSGPLQPAVPPYINTPLRTINIPYRGYF